MNLDLFVGIVPWLFTVPREQQREGMWPLAFGYALYLDIDGTMSNVAAGLRRKERVRRGTNCSRRTAFHSIRIKP